MLKFSKTQEKLVKQKSIGASVIKGTAKSGKTAVAIGRMFYLLEHACKAGENILFITLNQVKKQWVMASFNEFYASRNISLFDEELKGEVVIKEINELLEEAADKARVHLNLEVIDEIPEEILQEAIKKAKKVYPRVKWLRKDYLSFIAHEIRWMNSSGYFTFEAYQIADRKGTELKLPKQGSGRKAMWLMKELVSCSLKEVGQILKSEVQLETLQYLKEDALRNCYQHIIMDDAGDYTKVQLDFIRHLKSQGPGEVLFVMDKNESQMSCAWLSKGQNFKTIGYDMTGRVKHLTSRKKERVTQKVTTLEPTPLELFMALQEEKKIESTLTLNNKEKAQVIPIEKRQRGNQEAKQKSSSLPWYVETYKYINKVTGIETVFQKDSSAGETYIEEVKQEEIDTLPIYSDIAAGMPIEVVDEVSGTFGLPSELLHHKKNTYILHVQGDSMVGADISDGDYVVIQAGNVNNHEIAAVYYNGATTLKRIVQEDTQILLCSENPKYRPIVIEDGDFRVMGKLVGVIKAL